MSSVSSFEFVDSPQDTFPALSGTGYEIRPPITLERAAFTIPAYLAHATLERDSDCYAECDMITFIVSNSNSSWLFVLKPSRTIKVEKRLFQVPRLFIDRETTCFGKTNSSAEHSTELSDGSRYHFETGLYFARFYC